MSSTDRQREIERLGPWFHNLHLPDGTQTAPGHFLGDFPRYKWEQLAPALPDRLDGWRCLDIGCNAGFYAFELAKRGATVLGIDHDERYLTQARWAAEQFGMSDRVELRRMQAYDLARLDESFDLVLLLGVFYHLRYPLLGLDLAAERTRRLLAFQTLTMPGDGEVDTDDRPINERAVMLEPGWPKMAFIEHAWNADPTNWWAANKPACEAMLRSAGLEVVARPGDEMWVCRPSTEGRWWPRAELDSATGRT